MRSEETDRRIGISAAVGDVIVEEEPQAVSCKDGCLSCLYHHLMKVEPTMVKALLDRQTTPKIQHDDLDQRNVM